MRCVPRTKLRSRGPGQETGGTRSCLAGARPRGASLQLRRTPTVAQMFEIVLRAAWRSNGLEALPRLSAALGGRVEIWAKREDCNSGIAFGGNKVRKLEYLAADALAKGCDTLVSIGGIQSNHTRAVTGVARHLGLEAVTVQEHWVDWHDPGYELVGNIQLTRIMGGDVRIDPSGFDIGIRDSWKQALESVEAKGGKPYPIPAGASDHPLGGLGFANWIREVAEQEKQLGVFFDTIIVCTVTGSTHAGMIAGAALEGRGDRRIVGIDASGTMEKTVEQVGRIARQTAHAIGVE